MKYALITITDGTFLIRSEWSEVTGAIKAFHNLASALWNDTGFTEGYIAILDSNLDTYEGYKEFITHQPQPEPTPEVIEDTEE